MLTTRCLGCGPIGRVAVIVLAILGAHAIASQDAEPKPQEQAEPILPAAPVVTEHSVTINGRTIEYRATAGVLPIREDPSGKVRANIFFIAYERLAPRGDRPESDTPHADSKDSARTLADASPGDRPITFSFNGGPGSSSVWLHLGLLGPRRVEFGPEGEPLPPPARLVDNEFSWLDLTDMVFIDPVSTGFSRAAEGQNATQFHGLDEDVRAVGEFIRLYLTRHHRWLSPKYLIGESYGTTRAAALATELQDRLGIYLNGICFVSTVFNFQTLSFEPGNDTAYWLFLPTYTATAFHHKRLSGPLAEDLEKALAESERFARNEYQIALSRGDSLSEEERTAIAARLAELTGLDASFILRSDLRVPIFAFTKELLRSQSRTVGRLDSRYQGIDRSDATDRTGYDPSYAAILGPFTAALNHLVRAELKFESDLPYEILTGRVRPWNFGRDNRFSDVSESLRAAMSANRNLRAWFASGYYDLATPHFAADYTIDQLRLDPELRRNVTHTYYRSGHMMYVRLEDLRRMKTEASAFYAGGLPTQDRGR